METIRQIAAGVSVSAVIIGAFFVLCPDERSIKQIRFIAGLLMLFAVVTPFAGASFKLPEIQNEITYSAEAEAMLRGQAEYLAKSVLASEGVVFSKIEAIMDISPAGNIFIYRLCVYGVSEKEKANRILKDNFPECEVILE